MVTSGSSLKQVCEFHHNELLVQLQRKIWVYKGFMLLFVNSCQIDSTKIAIVGMVFWLPPNYWNAKLQRFSWTLSPLPQMFNTSFTDWKWRPWFVLITKLYAKIGMISFLNKLLLHDFFHQLFWTRHKYNKMNQDDFYKIKILMPFTRSRSWCHLQDQDLDAVYKIKILMPFSICIYLVLNVKWKKRHLQRDI